MYYCLVNNGKVLSGPKARPASWNGINNFNKLSNAELATHGWYPATCVNKIYNKDYQRREGPIFSFDGSTVTCTYTVIDKPLAAVKQEKIKKLARKRYEIETQGVIYNNILVKTDRESVSMIMATYTRAQDISVSSVNFKSDSGWQVLSDNDMIALGNMVFEHIQDCFDNEKTHHDAITALSAVTDVINYDIETGWPTL